MDHPGPRVTVSGATLQAVWLPGLTPYQPMWARQQVLVAARGRGAIGDRLVLLEHDHIYTNGRRGRRDHLLADPDTLAGLGANYLEVDRGGDITYHGPGQLIGYPIVDLVRARMGVRAFVRALEHVLLRTASWFGVEATVVPGYPGIWIGDAKLAAIGVKVSRGVTSHGFALNVDPDLAWFDQIVACGLPGRGVTSLSALLGHPVAVGDVAPVCGRAFAEVFDRELDWREHAAGEIPLD